MSEGSASSPPVLYLAGPPQRLRSIGPIPHEQLQRRLDFTPDGELARVMAVRRRPVRVRAVSRHDAPSVRLRMDRRTPPGTYRATIGSGPSSFLAEIRVEPSPRLGVRPAELRFEAGPGEEAMVDVVLENKGNVPIDVPDTAVVGIYDNNGIETALASTYRQETRNVERLVSHFVDKLREGHGGLLKIRIVHGAGPLTPGESRRTTLLTRLPVKLTAGHAYHGVWSLETLHSSVRVSARYPNTGETK